MRAPVGNQAARIFKPPTKCSVAAFGEVFRLRRLTEPELVIKSVRHGSFLEWAVADARRHEHVHFFQGADASVTDEFAREAETLAAALLGAGLENCFVVAH